MRTVGASMVFLSPARWLLLRLLAGPAGFAQACMVCTSASRNGQIPTFPAVVHTLRDVTPAMNDESEPSVVGNVLRLRRANV
jgi:hypothetical protein